MRSTQPASTDTADLSLYTYTYPLTKRDIQRQLLAAIGMERLDAPTSQGVDKQYQQIQQSIRTHHRLLVEQHPRMMVGLRGTKRIESN